jgi:hypothetical protein
MEKVFLGTILLILVASIYLVRKDSFYNLEKENHDDYTNYYRPAAVFTNQVVPAQKNQKTSKTELATLFREIITYANGSPGGANVNVAQNKYDLIFKDILVCSDKRNHEKYPNPNNYYVNLNVKLDKVYKAELIDVYIPAATDEAVNISTTGNRLYFSYINKPPKRCKKCTKDTSGCVQVDCSGCNCAQKKKEPPRVDGFITIQAGTYTSPDAIAREITRQFNIVLSGVGIKVDQTTGITVNYDKNLNRYNIRDRQICRVGTVILYTKNGYVLSPYSSVINSLGASMMLFDEVYISGPKETHLVNETLVVENAVPGDYGKVNGWNVPLNTDCQFSNCILSDVVLTHCKLYLSLGKLNGDTCNITPDENIISKKNVPPIFCQVPNNTCVSSAAVKTLLNQPHMFSAIQFYNPPISKVNKFEVKWYTDDGSLVRILDHCFTIRIYYFQKRIDTTDFSFPVP